MEEFDVKNWKCKSCGKKLPNTTMSSETNIFFDRYVQKCECGYLNIVLKKKR